MLEFILFLAYFPPFLCVILNEYCHISKLHTMCRFSENIIPNDCIDYKKIPLSAENKSDIVEIHNNLRNFVASGGYINETDTHFPEAAAMNYLRWNDELADIAQRWADQCIIEETQDECRDIEAFPVGQNTMIMEISKKDNIPNFPDILMTKWSNSFHHFNLKDIIEFNISRIEEIGQYSQLIWDTTEYIGCGLITFKNPFVEENSTVYILRMVCNYGPAGNVENMPIYRIGKSCSVCASKKCHENFRSLCIVKTQLQVGDKRIIEEVRKIMMEKYNMFQNGDECFCETHFDDDSSSGLNPSRIIIAAFVSLLLYLFNNSIN